MTKRNFDWDAEKAETNFRKHGVAFEVATRAFADTHVLTEFEDHYGLEDRWHTVGKVDGALLLLVVHTDRREGETDIIRIISARHANRKERLRYEENLRQIYN
jgi:uncharacterized protein